MTEMNIHTYQVRTDRRNKFVSLIQDKGEVLNTCELVKNPMDETKGVISYIVNVSEGFEESISEIAFMSFINNVEHQKYF